ncbi:23S rRNA pseudouridine2605 synthase [[Luteovulum] sphaeroides subsp. megalophilum]|uniref:pseudouridine synthase n=1 Tax=Cereibacter sphaeroides TaxID=1063 RepID=UPI000B6F4A73|nr:pseudouridine synthase [Cereibacter sphaeroides]SNS31532.1 23S rRNA pseudouridine2605 synthase [[Luteovulum] sphaeroides subsp. megalophilum]
MTDSKDGERIAKVLSRAGIASRRDAERMIELGRIAVNGRTIDSPALNVGPKDRITVDGQPLAPPEPARLWLYYKPEGLVTSASDEKGRETVFDHLPEGMPRVMSVGRLDLNSEGLLLLTNDGELKRRLELPSTGWLRKYRVRVKGNPTDADLEPLRKGITVEGESFQPMTVSLDRVQGANAWLTVGLREGKNREIRRAMSALGLTVNRLIRVSYGPFRLNELEPGMVEEVRPKILRDQLGLDPHADGEARPARGRKPEGAARAEGAARSERTARPPRGAAAEGPARAGRGAGSEGAAGPAKGRSPHGAAPRAGAPKDSARSAGKGAAEAARPARGAGAGPARASRPGSAEGTARTRPADGKSAAAGRSGKTEAADAPRAFRSRSAEAPAKGPRGAAKAAGPARSRREALPDTPIDARAPRGRAAAGPKAKGGSPAKAAPSPRAKGPDETAGGRGPRTGAPSAQGGRKPQPTDPRPPSRGPKGRPGGR